MKFEFDSRQPIYQQIIDKIITQIATGRLAPGARVASVRDLALAYNVNPNTMQRSLARLEEMGYLHTERQSRFVTNDAAMVAALARQMPQKIIAAFVQEMTDIGISAGQIAPLVTDYIERMGNNGENTAN